MQVSTIQAYSELLKSNLSHASPDNIFKEASFIILQLINALKALQAQGTEELPLSLTSFVLCKDTEKDCHYRLYVLPW